MNKKHVNFYAGVLVLKNVEKELNNVEDEENITKHKISYLLKLKANKVENLNLSSRMEFSNYFQFEEKIIAVCI